MAETKSFRAIPSGLSPEPSFGLEIVYIDEKTAIKYVEDANPYHILSYYKLPKVRLKLSILKLDGSCFDLKVHGTASIGDLKQVVEDVFSQSLSEEQGTISWSHVWGNSCLCFQHYKLTNDKEPLSHFRLKGGDQLQFIRHLSNLVQQEHGKKRAKSREQRKSSAESDHIGRKVEDDKISEDHTKDNSKLHSSKSLDAFKFTHALKRWISRRSKRKVHFHNASNDSSNEEVVNKRFARLGNSP